MPTRMTYYTRQSESLIFVITFLVIIVIFFWALFMGKCAISL